MQMRTLAGLVAGAFLTVAAATPALAQNKQLTIATGGTGGIYYPLAGGFGTIIGRRSRAIRPQPKSRAARSTT